MLRQSKNDKNVRKKQLTVEIDVIKSMKMTEELLTEVTNWESSRTKYLDKVLVQLCFPFLKAKGETSSGRKEPTIWVDVYWIHE